MARKIKRREPLNLQPLTKETLHTISEEMRMQLAIIGNECGVTFSFGAFSYDPYVGNFSVRVNGVMKGGKSREETIYEQNRVPLGLPKIRTVFSYSGSEYKILGYRPRASKKPILTEMVGSGKKYVFSVDAVKRAVK